MAVMDEFKEERALIKNAPLKTKIAYFWQYYKWFAIIPLVIVVALTSYIYHMVTKPDILLEGLFLNTYNMEAQNSADTLAEEFCEKYNINTKKYEVSLNSSLVIDGENYENSQNFEAIQTLMAWVGAGTIDFINGDLTTMNELAYRSYVTDLRDVFTEEELNKYAPYILYIDQAVIEENEKDISFSDSDKEPLPYPDCTKPEEMKKPIPVFIDVSKSKKVTELYTKENTFVFGVTAKIKDKDLLLSFLDYLME